MSTLGLYDDDEGSGSTPIRRQGPGRNQRLLGSFQGMLPVKAPQAVADYPGESIGERVAAKNLEMRNVAAAIDGILTNESASRIIGEVTEKLPGVLQKGGKKKQRGGGWMDDVKERYNFAKAVVLMSAYFADQVARDTSEAAWPPVKEFLMKEVITPVFVDVGKPAAKIALNLGYELFRTPITAIQLGISGVGYTANFVAQLTKLFNTWGRGTSSYLLSDDAAVKAATAAVATAKSTATTVGVGVAVANQLGLLPLSAILAAMLFTLQMNLSTGAGRAYVITNFYAWYNAQDAATQKIVNDNAIQYAKKAKEAAKTAAKSPGAAAAAASIKKATEAVARNLGAALSKAATTGEQAGKNAFAAVIGKGVSAAAAPVGADGVSQALEQAAPAAALAAEAVEAGSVPDIPAAPAEPAAAMDEAAVGPAVVGAPEAAANGDIGAQFARAVRARSKKGVGPGGGHKTKKGKSKRRVTRRRKAPKYLAAPVFAY